MWISFIASVKQHWTTSLYWHLFSIFQPSISAVGKTPATISQHMKRPAKRPASSKRPAVRRTKAPKGRGFPAGEDSNIMMDMMGWSMDYIMMEMDGTFYLWIAQIFQRWTRFPFPAAETCRKAPRETDGMMELPGGEVLQGHFRAFQTAVLVCFNGRFCEKQC